MHTTSAFFLLAAAVLAQQPPRLITSGAAVLRSGVTFKYQTMLATNGTVPPDIAAGLGEGGCIAGPDRLTRVMIDRRSQSYFGYDLAVAPSGDGNAYRATFGPPTGLEALLARHPVKSLKPLSRPAYPPPLLVHDGDTIAVDIMVSPDGAQTLTDYIEFHAQKPEPKPAVTTAEPRDFTPDDGQPTFDSFLHTIWVQGQKRSGDSHFTGRSGATFWIAFPGQGRYILSLVPRPGFLLAGAIRDNVVSFRDDKEYEVRFLTPILGAGKAFNLYMLHDLAYAPKPDPRNPVSMGVDRLENLLPKP